VPSQRHKPEPGDGEHPACNDETFSYINAHTLDDQNHNYIVYIRNIPFFGLRISSKNLFV
jgi:hypothetical protein